VNRSLFSSDFQSVLNDPVALGRFLTEAQEIAELEKAARRQATSLLLKGDKVPGWILRRRENQFVLPISLEPIANEALTMLLQYFGTISEQRYRALCSKCGVVPDPAAIVKAGATVYLSRQGSLGTSRSVRPTQFSEFR
jgi:hypothetical protein